MAKRRANGEGNIRKRSDGRWEGRYTVGRDPNTGKVIYKNVLAKTQKDCKEKLKRAIEENAKVDSIRAGQYTVGQWMDVWFENCAKIKVRIESKSQPKGLSAKTVRNINQVISSAMDFAIDQKLISTNPTDGCAPPKLEHREMRTLPAEQLASFLHEAKESGVFELYYIELATGLRRGELLRLKWEDIGWERGTIQVRRQIARIDGEVVEAPLETKNSYRSVSIGQDAVEILKEQRRKTNSEYVFPSPTGGPISPDSVLHMLHRVLKRAGLSKIRFHDTRHTFATVALQSGVAIKTVSGMLGHYSAGFTLDTYAHVTTQAQRQAANTMANILSIASTCSFPILGLKMGRLKMKRYAESLPTKEYPQNQCGKLQKSHFCDIFLAAKEALAEVS